MTETENVTFLECVQAQKQAIVRPNTMRNSTEETRVSKLVYLYTIPPAFSHVLIILVNRFHNILKCTSHILYCRGKKTVYFLNNCDNNMIAVSSTNNASKYTSKCTILYQKLCSEPYICTEFSKLHSNQGCIFY